MPGAFMAELLKLRKRPATFILLGVNVALVALFGYFIAYLFVVVLPTDDGLPPGVIDALLATLRPEAAGGYAVSNSSSISGPIALILGVLATGSEYTLRTVRLMVTQRPRRVALLLGKLGALAVGAVLLAISTLLSAVLSATLIAVLEGQPTIPPSGSDLIAALGAAWLVLLAWVSLGVALGVLLRGTGLPIGIGLVWGLVVEATFSALPFGGTIEAIKRGLLSVNASALGGSLTPGIDVTGGFGSVPEIEPVVAVAVLAGYVLVLGGVAVAVFARREIS
jgi:ABC-type transport system involved in multi-copper enzyme maturation permease subunit